MQALEAADTEPEGDVLDRAYLQSVELFVGTSQPDEPITYKQALDAADAEQWNAAMNEELASLAEMGTWETGPLPEDRKAISCKWVYRIKRDADGNPTRYKARLVARGFTQVYSLDYDETYAPVTRLETIRLLLGIACEKNWEIRQIDVKSAYLYGDLDEEIYMIPPPGYEVPNGHVLHLRKALYGLKQAGRQWYKTLRDELKKYGLVQIVNDPHTFIVRRMFNHKLCTLIVPVYVDDLLPMGDKPLVDNFEIHLPGSFNVSASGNATFFLGLRIERTREEDKMALRIDQAAFARTILRRFGYENKPEAFSPLSSVETLVPNPAPPEDCNLANRSRYQSMIGSLMYLMLGSRPDLAYSIGKLARFSSNPSTQHMHAIDRVLRYLKAYPDKYLEWIPGGTVLPDGFVDADFASDKSDRKSTTGYVFYLNGTLFSWSSKKQSTVATSTMEAEYIALFHASQQAAWIWQFYKQIGLPLTSPIEIRCDSEAAINVAKAEESHKASKHLDVKLHSIRERIEHGIISVLRVPTKENVADMFTKSLPPDTFRRHSSALGLEPDFDDPEEEEVQALLTPPEDENL